MRTWKKIEGFDFKEILFEEYNKIAKITINRPECRNAFTPLTTLEMSRAFAYCRECQGIRVVILTGACLLYTSPSPRDQRGSRMPSSA